MATQNNKTIDGRRLRSERSKKAILDACEALLKEGRLVPTAQMISDKAKVPIRSFFRHFPDMETLFHHLDQTMKPKYQRIFTEEVSIGSLSERIESAIKLHANCYEDNKPIFRSTKAQLWRYKTLQDNYSKSQKQLRKDLDNRLPELRSVDKDTRELVDSITSYEMWERLRDYQKLSRARSIKLIQALVERTILDAIAHSS